jgi:hypothetical protein
MILEVKTKTVKETVLRYGVDKKREEGEGNSESVPEKVS